ncbi:hypothetical protein LOK49_Contig18G00003 [Camellia lanceoleosa]|nr:hypothetical protein LOK49_Contig18G00003 [Camellia lanceoleosa]
MELCCKACPLIFGYRAASNLQDVRINIFRSKRRKVKARSCVSLHYQGEERRDHSHHWWSALPSINTDRHDRRRSKAIARKASSDEVPAFPNQKPVKKEEDYVEDHPRA